ncbi:alcohol dehydrogenase [Dethiosulfatibacter aminovorans DSM 17477]|uniref:Alcohol dehydrogenase n=1 Tax=Dethiosulfatibacter aminovorans DSM 17477 TaxID=1121476 RepID=A0A1M6L8Q7_9FIRM|nr:iron-containing alcohol dehydrogenase [Dethiosulfatibacter aminovorans]SHJ67597.1 alcohol dehydrogenase [Dethiosulfatibacter aminovorans DSM 17477]
MINHFRFIIPTKINYGAGNLSLLPRELEKLGSEKVMVVTDSKLIRLKLVERLEKLLAGYDYVIYDGIEQNPKDYNITNATAYAVREEVDTIIAFGGGSPNDAAKMIAVMAAQGGDIKEYMFGKREIEKKLNLIAIPTTAGTGSEVAFWSVITNSEEKLKYSIRNPILAPDVAIVDPELTLTVPPEITATSGIDALTHAIEGYTSLRSEPIADAMALCAISHITKYIEAAVNDGSDLEARDKMMIGSLMAGMSIVNTDVGAVHCMAEALGSTYDSPHGICNSVLLPYVMEYNVIKSEEKYARMANYMNVYGPNDLMTASEGIEHIKILSKRIGLPNIKSLKVTPDDFSMLANMAERNASSLNNPRKIGKEDYLKIFIRAYEDSDD